MELTNKDLEILTASTQRVKIEGERGYYRLVAVGEMAAELLELREQTRWRGAVKEPPESETYCEIISEDDDIRGDYYNSRDWPHSPWLSGMQPVWWRPFPILPQPPQEGE